MMRGSRKKMTQEGTTWIFMRSMNNSWRPSFALFYLGTPWSGLIGLHNDRSRRDFLRWAMPIRNPFKGLQARDSYVISRFLLSNCQMFYLLILHGRTTDVRFKMLAQNTTWNDQSLFNKRIFTHLRAIGYNLGQLCSTARSAEATRLVFMLLVWRNLLYP